MTLDDLKRLANQPGDIAFESLGEHFSRLSSHLIALWEACNSADFNCCNEDGGTVGAEYIEIAWTKLNSELSKL